MRRGQTKRPYFFSIVAILLSLCFVLQACGSSATSSNGEKTVTVAYEQFGPPPYYDQQWWQNVQKQLDANHANIKLKLEPIVADEGSYYTKLDLMLRSASTAPDLIREDSFLIGSDATAGYLQPLDSYLNSWSDYQQWFPSMKAITTFGGHNYGVMNGTDVRLVWYNKSIFQKAGLPTTWQPTNWSDILQAAQTIKAKVPGVIPMNLFSGVPMDEASSMQGFEMLLYGTQNPLYDYKTGKWVTSSKGFQDSLNFVQQVYNPAHLLGPTNDIALNTTAANTVAEQLLPQGKLAIDIDGSWLPQNWATGGQAPWPQWQQTLGMAKMPTEFGAAPSSVTLSGGWAYSIASKSQNKAAAWQVLQVANSASLLGGYDVAAAQITPRKDVVSLPAYANLPGNSFFTSLVSFSQFRPAFPAYPKISVQIDSAMQGVMQGKSPADAMASYGQAVTAIAGAGNVETQ